MAQQCDGKKSIHGHPCFGGKRHQNGRIHLGVAPRCNIKCGYCTRRHDCVNESRRGDEPHPDIGAGTGAGPAQFETGGYLLMEVRCRRPDTCGDGCADFFKNPDCARTFTCQELDSFLLPRGFRRISHYYRNHAVAAIYQLG